MVLVRRLIWAASKVSLFAIVAGLLALTLARDNRPTSASHTEILPSSSNTTATYMSSKILVKGGSITATPCNPDVEGTDPRAACLRVWVKNVDNATGASAFQVHGTFSPTGLVVNGASTQTAWLGSTQRSVTCSSPDIGPGDVLLSCNTLLPPPNYGPKCPSQCTGLLATMGFVSQMEVGVFTVDFSSGTYLVDTPANPSNAAPIPATVRSTQFIVAPCADFNGDGSVRIADILYVVSKYFTNDIPADLTGDGEVRVNDILIAVGEYFFNCTA